MLERRVSRQITVLNCFEWRRRDLADPPRPKSYAFGNTVFLRGEETSFLTLGPSYDAKHDERRI